MNNNYGTLQDPLCSPKFPHACKRISSKFIDNLGTHLQKRFTSPDTGTDNTYYLIIQHMPGQLGDGLKESYCISNYNKAGKEAKQTLSQDSISSLI
jgi:hypothetical protein